MIKPIIPDISDASKILNIYKITIFESVKAYLVKEMDIVKPIPANKLTLNKFNHIIFGFSSDILD